jgi:hypothetical protein
MHYLFSEYFQGLRAYVPKNKNQFYKLNMYEVPTKGEIHETLQICKSLTKRQIQYFNNIGCRGFEFATPYRALPSFVNDPLSI